ncbi:MAG TPA: TetR/AcrR family transcriptional regulator [Flavobacteriales bacterium]|nr:TetR/AcrR family transcriptional regulator [Flavobacteriales bacterium]
MNEKLEHIIQQARSIFMRCGIRSVTMDDVCREMRISKKTLYQHVHDKTDLVNQTMRSEIAKDEVEVSTLISLGLSAIDEMFEITRIVSEKIRNIHPSILFDMQKYYPEAWEMMRIHRNDFIERVIQKNIQKGQDEGVYRSNMNAIIVSRLFATKIDVLSDNHFFEGTGLSMTQVNFEHLTYHLYGISTPKGIYYLEQKLSNLNPQSL